MRAPLTLPLWLLLCGSTPAQDPSPFIVVDQFGYLPDATKVAVLRDPRVGYDAAQAYAPAGPVELRREADDSVVFTASAQPWNAGAVHALSGDAGWWFDFSDVQAPGSYYVLEPASDERSATFRVAADVYRPVLVAAQKMFYFNRCNAPKLAAFGGPGWIDGTNFTHAGQDSRCRYVDAPDDASLEKSLVGGWFDAGDYNKYVTLAAPAVHDLLSAYEENPAVFGDDFGLPESGNGVPDVLDEVRWELDWLFRMSNPDGSVHLKMGSIAYDENNSAPPSANTDPRYYGPPCSSASIALAGMFAHAARVYAGLPDFGDYAQQLEDRAVAAWDHVAPLLASGQLDLDCDDGTIKAGDADWSMAVQRSHALTAAIYLFAVTGDAAYGGYVTANSGDAEPLATGFWGPYELTLHTALLTYATLPGANAALAGTIVTSATDAAANDWSGFFGFNANDLYRTFIPSWSYHWGSNSPHAAFGVLNRLLVHSGILPASHDDFTQQAREHVHWFHGVNPLGITMLSNMYALGAERCADQIYHTWFQDGSPWDDARASRYGPAPGFVVGGPNASFSVPALSPPAGQPEMKSYLDFNDGYPNSSWEITEPAIYSQAVFVRLLANFVPEAQRPDGARATTGTQNFR